MSDLAVSLTVEQLRQLVATAVKAELDRRDLPSDVLTLDEAAELLKFHPKSMARRLEELKIPAHRIGREWRFRRSELLAWVSEQKAA